MSLRLDVLTIRALTTIVLIKVFQNVAFGCIRKLHKRIASRTCIANEVVHAILNLHLLKCSFYFLGSLPVSKCIHY